jgi:ABC-type transport system substrate-binding protein
VREAMGWDATDALWMELNANGLSWASITGGEDDDFIIATPFTLGDFNPFDTMGYYREHVLSPIFPGLFNLSPETELMIPGLAAGPVEWEGLEATVTLREDVTFSNGAPMDAYDVLNSWAWAFSEDTGSLVKEFILPYISSIDSITVLDNHKVKFNFDLPYFAPETILSSVVILPDEIIGPVDAPLIPDYDFNFDPINTTIGTGPFALSEVLPEGGIKLTAVENWWGGQISADSVYFSHISEKTAAIEAIKTGEVDYLEDFYGVYPNEIEGTDGVKAIEGVMTGGVQMFALNLNHPVFGTGVDTPLGREDPARAAEAAKYVRHAINHMIPRDQIVDEVLMGQGVPAVSNWSPLDQHWDSNQVVAEFSLEKAEEFLELAGYDMDAINPPGSEESETLDVPISLFAIFLGFNMAVMIQIIKRKK